jgi:hypothetical protein
MAGPSNAVIPDPPIPDVPAIMSARSGRRIRMPARYADFLPAGPTNLPHIPPPPNSPLNRVVDNLPNHQPMLVPYQTTPDSMGLFRVYAQRPTLIPIANEGLDAIADAPSFDTQSNPHLERSRIVPGLPSPDIRPEELFSAFSSPTAGLLFCWQYSGSNSKSNAEMKRLVRDFLDDDEYRREDARVYDDVREKKFVQDYLKDRSNPFRMENGWRCSSVNIRLPKEKVKFASEEAAPEMEISGIYHRCITDIIKSVFEDSIISTFHLTPFQQQWYISEGRTVKVYSEAYSSPAFLEAYKEINALPRDPDDKLERVVASLMMWSDSTHLASFGDASLWPFYLCFGNQSKYTRGKPTASACHHVAYIPNVSPVCDLLS